MQRTPPLKSLKKTSGSILSSFNVECDFCDELAGGEQNAFRQRYGSEVRHRHIPISETYFLFPSLGQIAEGHVLLVPHSHVTSMAALTIAETEELEEVCGRVRRILKEVYGACIFFEHGVRRAGSGGCGIQHAHMHAVPVQGTGVLEVLGNSFQGSSISRLADVDGAVSQELSYLYFETCQGERYVFGAPSMPSQYMRRVVCESLRKQNWDWRAVGYEPGLIATVNRFSAEFPTAPARSEK